jgi:hypothetical protein
MLMHSYKTTRYHSEEDHNLKMDNSWNAEEAKLIEFSEESDDLVWDSGESSES